MIKLLIRSAATAVFACGMLSSTAYGQDNSPPLVSFSEPAAFASFESGTTVSVAVDASDPDGEVRNVELSLDGEFIRQERVDPYQWGERDPVLRNLPIGVHQLTAVAIDNDGATSSVSISIEVTGEEGAANDPGNTPPLVSFADLGDATFDEGNLVELAVNASDPDGAIENVALYKDGDFIRQENFDPYQWGERDPLLQNMEVGVYELTAVATDNAGATTSVSVSVEIIGGDTAPEPDPPVVVEPEPPVVVEPEPPVVVEPEPPVVVEPEPPVVVEPEPPVVVEPEPPVVVEPEPITPVVSDSPAETEAVSFLLASTFGPIDDSVEELQQMGYSAWLVDQFNSPMSSILAGTQELQEGRNTTFRNERFPKSVWYQFAIENEDQLRQRVAFALSEIFVVSSAPGTLIRRTEMQSLYMDILQEGAFGNFRDLLEEITYSNMMGQSLTYQANAKADSELGTAPDENYAREIMQLFTIGLHELNLDGSLKLDGNGNSINTFDIEDVTELAKIFTGLDRDDERSFGRVPGLGPHPSDLLRMRFYNEFHSPGEKTFLGSTVPDFGDGDRSIEATMDILANHPNVAPFITKQLIQHLTTSNPSGDYVEHVATAFLEGTYTLPDGTLVGSGRSGDLESTVAAILMYPGAITRFQDLDENVEYGKVREPILRFVHWARVSGVNSFVIPENIDNFDAQELGQGLPFRAGSVFNFFRPGFVAPGTETAASGLVAPEMQIESGSNLISYANTMRDYVWSTRESSQEDSFYPNYDDDLLDRAQSVEGIVDYMNFIYTGNRMHPDTLQAMYDAVDSVDEDNERELLDTRVRVATMLAVNTIEFKTQK